MSVAPPTAHLEVWEEVAAIVGPQHRGAAPHQRVGPATHLTKQQQRGYDHHMFHNSYFFSPKHLNYIVFLCFIQNWSAPAPILC